LIFQLIWWIGGGILTGVAWAITGTLSAVLIGLLCIPFACVISAMPLVALGYGVYAGVQTSQGQDFKYWLIGDWVRSTLTIIKKTSPSQRRGMSLFLISKWQVMEYFPKYPCQA
jgi:hypothetical protein